MPESATAEVIQFPVRASAPVATGHPGPAQAEPTQAEARLTRALIGLNNALEAQQAAVAAWKSSLGDLSMATGQLGVSLRRYHDSLGQLDAAPGRHFGFPRPPPPSARSGPRASAAFPHG